MVNNIRKVKDKDTNLSVFLVLPVLRLMHITSKTVMEAMMTLNTTAAHTAMISIVFSGLLPSKKCLMTWNNVLNCE